MRCAQCLAFVPSSSSPIPRGNTVALPRSFCWTKYGTEAGEATSSILARKESERLGNNGIFLWGIGTSVRPSLMELVASDPAPTVVFSPMRSQPAARDVAPERIVRWRSAIGLDGAAFELPPSTTVTSRFDGKASRPKHFALVCSSEVPLPADPTPQERRGWIDDGQLRNIRSGRPVGSSQVTSVVRRVGPDAPTCRYRVGFDAELSYPYFLVLGDCEVIEDPLRLLERAMSAGGQARSHP